MLNLQKTNLFLLRITEYQAVIKLRKESPEDNLKQGCQSEFFENSDRIIERTLTLCTSWMK